MRYWLIKSEPTTYGIDHIARDKTTAWTGVRNFQARNFMRDQMKVGDRAFFYHSNCEEPGIVGIVEGIIYLTKSDEEFVRTYIQNKKGWF